MSKKIKFFFPVFFLPKNTYKITKFHQLTKISDQMKFVWQKQKFTTKKVKELWKYFFMQFFLSKSWLLLLLTNKIFNYRKIKLNICFFSSKKKRKEDLQNFINYVKCLPPKNKSSQRRNINFQEKREKKIIITSTSRPKKKVRKNSIFSSVIIFTPLICKRLLYTDIKFLHLNIVSNLILSPQRISWDFQIFWERTKLFVRWEQINLNIYTSVINQ